MLSLGCHAGQQRVKTRLIVVNILRFTYKKWIRTVTNIVVFALYTRRPLFW